MSKTWIRGKSQEFARDVLRDYCLATRELEKQFREYDRSGAISFDELQDLTGEEMNKGLLWRLKDTAHHLFRLKGDERLIGRFLDWALGYIFHETLKLKEDAHQLQNYGPWFRALEEEPMPEMERTFCTELTLVLLQTRESIEREIRRIRFIMTQCQAMFPVYYARYADNPLLARFLFMRSDLVRTVFDERFAQLVAGIYGDCPETMYHLAAQSLRQGGWLLEAKRAIEAGLGIQPDHAGLLETAKAVAQALREPPADAASRPPLPAAGS